MFGQRIFLGRDCVCGGLPQAFGVVNMSDWVGKSGFMRMAQPCRTPVPHSADEPCLFDSPPHQPSDGDLLSLLVAGNKPAFEALYLRHWPQLVRHLYQKHKVSWTLAEDLSSEVFIDVWLTRDRLGSIKNFSAYLRGIAHNHVADRRGGEVTLSIHVAHSVASSDPGPEADAQNSELLQKLEQAIASLAESHRTAYVMRSAGASVQQIAISQGCTEKAAERRLEKAIEGIRRDLSTFISSNDGKGCTRNRVNSKG